MMYFSWRSLASIFWPWPSHVVRWILFKMNKDSNLCQVLPSLRDSTAAIRRILILSLLILLIGALFTSWISRHRTLKKTLRGADDTGASHGTCVGRAGDKNCFDLFHLVSSSQPLNYWNNSRVRETCLAVMLDAQATRWDFSCWTKTPCFAARRDRLCWPACGGVSGHVSLRTQLAVSVTLSRISCRTWSIVLSWHLITAWSAELPGMF